MKAIPPAPADLPHPLCPALAAFLWEARLRCGLSRYEAARRSRVSDEMIRLVETGRCVPTIDRAARLCEAYGLRLSEALRRSERRLEANGGPVFRRK